MVIMCKLSPYTQTNCVPVHSLIHERVIFCQFLAFFEALKAVGLARHKFEVRIRTIEHKRMGYREENGKIEDCLVPKFYLVSLIKCVENA